jgi:NitT/TauT family transport system ATP-binding protein
VGVAFVIGAPIAVIFGFLIGEWREAEKSTRSLINYALNIPQSIFLPIFILVFGIGFFQKVVFGITHLFLITLVTTVAAVQSIPSDQVTALRSFGASRAQIYFRLYLPGMLPLVLTGLRLGLIFCILGVLLAEMYASQTGLGKAIFTWGESGETVSLTAALIANLSYNNCDKRADACLRTLRQPISTGRLQNMTANGGQHAGSSAVVEVRGLSKIFANNLWALDDINLIIKDGQFLSIVGPSGCGKSTLLKIVAGLSSASTGQVIVNGKEITKPQPEEIAVVFQDALLLPWKTSLQNVKFPLELRGLAPAVRRERSVEMINLVGLGKFKDSYPYQLSGGMRQRVSIARGLAQNPRIILMDEPFGALDEQTRTRMGEELVRIWEQFRTTVLFITHSLTEAIFLSDMIVVMGRNPGRIIECIEVPLTRPRVADMIGSDVFGQLRNRIWHMLTDESDEALRAKDL